MKPTIAMSALCGALMLATFSPATMAATSSKATAAQKSTQAQKPTEMTCEQFVALDETVKPKVVYWSEGFNKKGKVVNDVVDIDSTDRIVPMLITECQASPKASFWQKFKKHF